MKFFSGTFSQIDSLSLPQSRGPIFLIHMCFPPCSALKKFPEAFLVRKVTVANIIKFVLTLEFL